MAMSTFKNALNRMEIPVSDLVSGFGDLDQELGEFEGEETEENLTEETGEETEPTNKREEIEEEEGETQIQGLNLENYKQIETEEEETVNKTIETEEEEEEEVTVNKTIETEEIVEIEKELATLPSMTLEILDIDTDLVENTSLDVYENPLTSESFAGESDVLADDVRSVDIRDTNLNKGLEYVKDYEVIEVDDSKILLSKKYLENEQVNNYFKKIKNHLDKGRDYQIQLINKNSENRLFSVLSYKELAYLKEAFSSCIFEVGKLSSDGSNDDNSNFDSYVLRVRLS